MPDDLQEWTLPTQHLGQRVCIYDRLDSTNTLALSLAHDPAQHGLVILAREQSAGRGQYGRTWHAPPGSSVLMSMLLFPPTPLRRPALLTAWAAVSVCETVHKIAGLQPKIKWPNDVLVDGKKVCGILIEQRTTGNADLPLASVVGIGLNVTQTAAMFEDAGLPDAASLAMLARRAFEFDDVATALIAELDAQYTSLLTGEVGSLESLWAARLGLLDKYVVVEGIQENLRGRLVDVSLSGLALDVNGEIVHLTPESVKHLHAV